MSGLMNDEGGCGYQWGSASDMNRERVRGSKIEEGRSLGKERS